jgi:hypothetical protein
MRFMSYFVSLDIAHDSHANNAIKAAMLRGANAFAQQAVAGPVARSTL